MTSPSNLARALEAWRAISEPLRKVVCTDAEDAGRSVSGDEGRAYRAALDLLRAAAEPEAAFSVDKYEASTEAVRRFFASHTPAEVVAKLREIAPYAFEAADPEAAHKCADCKHAINEGEAKVFGVCDGCWDRHYRSRIEGAR